MKSISSRLFATHAVIVLVVLVLIGMGLRPEAHSLTPAAFTSIAGAGLADPPYQAGFPIDVGETIWFSSPTVADLDGDGDDEIVLGDGEGRVHAWHHTGVSLPNFPRVTGDGRVNGPLAVGDVDGDGDLEIAAGTRARHHDGQGRVYLWHHDGQLVAGWPIAVHWNTQGSDGQSEVHSVCMADVDGDGDLEILAGTSNNAGYWDPDDPDVPPHPNFYAWHHDGTPVSGTWPTYYRTAGIYGAIAAGDLTGDGRANPVTGRDHVYLYTYTGDGAYLPGWPVRTYLDGRYGVWGANSIIEWTRAAPVLGDLDGDGQIEMVVAGKLRVPPDYPSVASALLVLGPDGERRPGWASPARGGAPLYSHYEPRQAPALADLDADGDLEIIVTTVDGWIRAYHHTGALVWAYDYAQGNVVFATEPVVGDVDGDRLLEIVFATYDPTFGSAPVGLWALEADGTVAAGFPLAVDAPGIRAAPTLADVDGDGDLEILTGGLDGYLRVWDLAAPANPYQLPWPTGRHDTRRTAFYQRTAPDLGTSLKWSLRAAPRRGEVVTYTIRLRNLGTPLDVATVLTDLIPAGLAYVPATLTATLGAVDDADGVMRWTGTLGGVTAVDVTYAVTVTTGAIRVITNTVTIDAGPAGVYQRTASIVANGYTVRLPVVMRSAP